MKRQQLWSGRRKHHLNSPTNYCPAEVPWDDFNWERSIKQVANVGILLASFGSLRFNFRWYCLKECLIFSD